MARRSSREPKQNSWYKLEEEDAKEQMKAAKWKLAADAQNEALAAQYAEWQAKAEEDSKLVQAREQAEAGGRRDVGQAVAR